VPLQPAAQGNDNGGGGTIQVQRGFAISNRDAIFLDCKYFVPRRCKGYREESTPGVEVQYAHCGRHGGEDQSNEEFGGVDVGLEKGRG